MKFRPTHREGNIQTALIHLLVLQIKTDVTVRESFVSFVVLFTFTLEIRKCEHFEF